MAVITIDSAQFVAFSIGVFITVILASFWNFRFKSQYTLIHAQRLEKQQQEQQTEKDLADHELSRIKGDLQVRERQVDALNTQLEEIRLQLHRAATETQLERQKLLHLKGVEQRHEECRNRNEVLIRQLQVQKTQSQADQHSLQEQLALLTSAKAQLSNEFESLANKIFEDKRQVFQHQSKGALDASINPLREQLQSFRQKVEDVYLKESSDRHQLVGKITELQKQTQQIGLDAINLTNALKGDNKTQGNWGEVILERLLEESGLQKGREYDVQVALQSEEGKRRNPDVIIRLPENKDIIIDSKVSLVHYERYSSSDDHSERDQYLQQHVKSIRAHIHDLSGKSYEKLAGIRSLDFVFIFIPVEAAFMAALQAEPQLFREAYDKQIVLVSPTTLLATLRTVENIWRYEKQNKNSEEIARQAGALYDKFASLVEAMNDARKHIDKTSAAFETVEKRLFQGSGNLVKRVETIRQLGAKTKKQLSAELINQADTQDSDVQNTPELCKRQTPSDV